MGQISNDAAVKNALIYPSKEECALNTGQRLNYVAIKDAQIKLRIEECALGMVQGSNDAAVKDVLIMPLKEECAAGMVQRSSYAVWGISQYTRSIYCVWIRIRDDYCNSNPAQSAFS